MPEVFIIGAGLAGLLAANMLHKRFMIMVYEQQQTIPNNHSALLRFRTDAVSRETGIPFRKVRVLKAVLNASSNPISDALLYFQKVSPNGKLELRSSINLDPVDRFIAPPDFIDRLARDTTILYQVDALKELGARDIPTISTVPMKALMDALDYPGPRPEFAYRQGATLSFYINADLYLTMYDPWPESCFYRVSITGNRVIGESLGSQMLLECPQPRDVMKKYFGIDIETSAGEMKPQAYAKINYLSDEDRRAAERFQLWASVNHNIFSLGRFATWRAGLLLDDVVSDVNKIAGWIENGSFSVMKETP
jgi:hypothetical protein